MTEQDKKFAEFVGAVACEDDGGWSKEVWDAAWQAAIDSLKKQTA